MKDFTVVSNLTIEAERRKDSWEQRDTHSDYTVANIETAISNLFSLINKMAKSIDKANQ